MGKKEKKNQKKKPSRKHSSQSTTIINYTFPDKIISSEILPRLDVKSLLRFRSVSKQWRNAIDAASFADTHLALSHVRARILLSFSNFEGSKHYFFSVSVNGGEAVRHLSLPGCNKGNKTSPCDCYVSESLNGLLFFNNGTQIYIINPSTRKIVPLPQPESIQRYNSKIISTMQLIYSNYSFGFDPVNNEYKILHIIGCRYNCNATLQKVVCDVISIRSDYSTTEWRKIPHVPPYPFIFRSQSVCVGGVIYWIGIRSPGEEIIIAFDLKQEKFHPIPIPDSVPSKPSLSSNGGCLSLIGHKNNSCCLIDFWVLVDREKLLWTKNTVMGPQNFRPKIFVPLANKMMLMASLFSRYEVVGPYNDHEKQGKQSKSITIRGLPAWTELFEAMNTNFRMCNYVESFIMGLPRSFVTIGEVEVRVSV